MVLEKIKPFPWRVVQLQLDFVWLSKQEKEKIKESWKGRQIRMNRKWDLGFTRESEIDEVSLRESECLWRGVHQISRFRQSILGLKLGT